MATPNFNLILYSRVADIQWSAGAITGANTALDGTGAVTVIYTADATNGGLLQKLRLKPTGTNVASVGRHILNNGSTNTVAANNSLYGESTLAANTLSQVAASVEIDYLLPMALPPGYRFLETIGTAIAGGIQVTGVGGKY